LLSVYAELGLIRCAGDVEQKRAFEAVCCHIVKMQSGRSHHVHVSSETSVSNHRPRHHVVTAGLRSLSNRQGDGDISSKLQSNAGEVRYSNLINDGDGPTNRQHRKPCSTTDNGEQIQDGRLRE